MVAIQGVLLGLVLLGLGLLGVRHAYVITRFEENLDAIGSSRQVGSVEPADWNVLLTKVIGGCVAAGGVITVLLALSG
ncbi:hypothetical protein [Haloarchaeobius sp. HRN-SO-5]|uniref:hypothetical protein n=1 Tax=Haloarchaeobius sp. HRN-SO-5 TaxID=3446118 RepID=UPI003EB6D643